MDALYGLLFVQQEIIELLEDDNKSARPHIAFHDDKVFIRKTYEHIIDAPHIEVAKKLYPQNTTASINDPNESTSIRTMLNAFNVPDIRQISWALLDISSIRILPVYGGVYRLLRSDDNIARIGNIDTEQAIQLFEEIKAHFGEIPIIYR